MRSREGMCRRDAAQPAFRRLLLVPSRDGKCRRYAEQPAFRRLLLVPSRDGKCRRYAEQPAFRRLLLVPSRDGMCRHAVQSAFRRLLLVPSRERCAERVRCGMTYLQALLLVPFWDITIRTNYMLRFPLCSSTMFAWKKNQFLFPSTA